MQMRSLVKLVRALSSLRNSLEVRDKSPRPPHLILDLESTSLPVGYQTIAQPNGSSIASGQWAYADGKPYAETLDADHIRAACSKGLTAQLPGYTPTLHFSGHYDSGRRAMVFHATTEDGKQLALKIAHSQTAQNLAAIALEAPKWAVLTHHKIPCPKLLTIGRDYLIREWTVGLTAEEWLRAPQPSEDSIDGLTAFIQHCCRERVAIYDFKPANLVWCDDASGWHCIDPGKLEIGASPRTLLDHYRASLRRKWFDHPVVSPMYLANVVARLPTY